MKNKNYNIPLPLLTIVIIATLILNYLQGCQTEKLAEEVKNLEYVQEILTSRIQSLEAREATVNEE